MIRNSFASIGERKECRHRKSILGRSYSRRYLKEDFLGSSPLDQSGETTLLSKNSRVSEARNFQLSPDDVQDNQNRFQCAKGALHDMHTAGGGAAVRISISDTVRQGE